MINLKNFFIGLLLITSLLLFGFVLSRFSFDPFWLILIPMGFVFYFICSFLGHFVTYIYENSTLNWYVKSFIYKIKYFKCKYTGHPKNKMWWYTSPCVPPKPKHIGYCWYCRENIYEGKDTFR